jgi:hypothetical protein
VGTSVGERCRVAPGTESTGPRWPTGP